MPAERLARTGQVAEPVLPNGREEHGVSRLKAIHEATPPRSAPVMRDYAHHGTNESRTLHSSADPSTSSTPNVWVDALAFEKALRLALPPGMANPTWCGICTRHRPQRHRREDVRQATWHLMHDEMSDHDRRDSSPPPRGAPTEGLVMTASLARGMAFVVLGSSWLIPLSVALQKRPRSEATKRFE